MSSKIQSIGGGSGATALAVAVAMALFGNTGRAADGSSPAATDIETVQAGQDPCAAEQAALKTSIAQVQEDYKAKISTKAGEYTERAAGLKKDSEDAKPSTAGAMVGIDLDVTWKDQTIIFDTPSVIIKENKIILGIPEVILKEQHWIYDLPGTYMGVQKVGEYPELTCGDGFLGLGCTVKMSPILISVPQFRMERHDVILGVPEFAVRDQAFIFGLPQVFLERQKIILGLPQFTVKNVKAEIGHVKQEASEFAQQANAETAALSTAMQAAISKTGSEKLHQVFQCHRTQVVANKDRAISQIDAQIASSTAAAKSARDAHASAQADSADAVVQQLIATRTATEAQFDTVAKQMDAAEEKAISSLDARQADNLPIPGKES